MSYRIVLQRNGHDIGTLYWNGSLEETRRLATHIAIECEVDAYEIFDFTDAEATSEERPPLREPPNGNEGV